MTTTAFLIGWLASLGLGLYIAGNWSAGNAAAIYGTLWIGFWSMAGMTWFEIVLAKRPTSGPTPEETRELDWQRWQQLRLPILIGSRIIPGVWIGLKATSPFLVALAYVGISELLYQINERVSPRLAPLTLQRRPHWQGVLRTACIVLLSVLLGFLIRVLVIR